MSFTWLAGVDIRIAVGIVVLAYLLLLVWGLTRPREEILRGAPDRRRWRDLRLWVVPLVLVQVVLYLWLR